MPPSSPAPARRALIVLGVLLFPLAAQDSRPIEPDADPAWTILAGRTPAPPLPAAMASCLGRVFLASGAAVDEYLPAGNAWKSVAALPAPVGTGVAIGVDPAGALWILRGGKTPDVWRVDVATGAVAATKPLPKPAGRGAALAFDHDRKQLYATRGDMTREFYRYDPAANEWKQLVQVGDKSKLAAMGQSSGGLQYSKGMVYAWPDHHVQRYDVAKGTWLEHVHMSYGQRPWWDGMAYAPVEGTDVWCVIQGGLSRTLSIFDPNRRLFAFLRPRLPLLYAGEGSRAVIVPLGGVPTLFVYAIEGGNRMLRIPLLSLQQVTKASPASDAGSPWTTWHEDSGSSLVRRPARLPVLGLMGKAGSRWYFGRLQNLRFFDPAARSWSDYPGAPLGRTFGDGLCAASDGAAVFVLTGSSRNFVAVDVGTLAVTQLPEPDTDILLGAQAAFAWGRLWVLAGGETRSVRVFDPAARAWGPGVPLPEEAAPAGLAGSALLVSGDALVAITGRAAWRLPKDGTAWTRAAELPFALSPDGGMAAADGTRAVLVEGGGSRRLAAVDLAGGSSRVHLLPDVASVAGQRAVIDDVDGKRCVCIHRGHDTHEILIRPLDELFR